LPEIRHTNPGSTLEAETMAEGDLEEMRDPTRGRPYLHRWGCCQ